MPNWHTIAAWFDLSTYPEGTVRGTLCSAVVFGTILYFWLHKDWALPAELATMLSAAWGLVMSLEARSSLKGWLVMVMVLNVMAMLLFVPGSTGQGWVNPVLGGLAVAGFTQYVAGRIKETPAPATP